MGGWGEGGVLAPDCTPRLLQPARSSSPQPDFPAPQIPQETPEHLWREWGEDASRGGGRRTAPDPHSSSAHASPPPPPRPLPLPRLRGPPPRGSSLGGGGARSGAGVVAPGGAGRRGEGAGARVQARARARAGSGLLRKQPREGILGAGSAPSRARGAGPRAARVTGQPSPTAASAASGALRLPRVGGRAVAAAGVAGPGEAAGKSALCSHPALPTPTSPCTPGLRTPPSLLRNWGLRGWCRAFWWPDFRGGSWNSSERRSPFPTPTPHPPEFQGGLFPQAKSEERVLDLNLSLVCWREAGRKGFEMRRFPQTSLISIPAPAPWQISVGWS